MKGDFLIWCYTCDFSSSASITFLITFLIRCGARDAGPVWGLAAQARDVWYRVNTYQPPEVPHVQKAAPQPGPKQKPPAPARPAAKGPHLVPDSIIFEPAQGEPASAGSPPTEDAAEKAALLALNAELKRKLSRMQQR
jgi:hypothetical protein